MYLKVLYTGAVLYATTVVLIKISQLFLYHRLFPIRFMGSSCLVVGISVVTWGLTTCIVGLLLCDPIQKAWHPGAPGQCLNGIQFYYGLQISNIVTDVIIVVLPLRPVFNLHLTSKERVVLVGFFGLGTL